MAEFIYTMKKVRKAHGDKVILDDVTLNFLPGAKIGVVGPNGAGKSSVLRIMAGLDKANNGEAFLATGASVGILMQEPVLDETKTVRENVEEGVPIKGKLNRYNEVAELMATDYSDELMEEMGKLQEELDAADAWDIDSQLEQAMDALRCPPPDDPVIDAICERDPRAFDNYLVPLAIIALRQGVGDTLCDRTVGQRRGVSTAILDVGEHRPRRMP